jgi:polyhydroxyalkanoate synthesis regulator phasin
VDENLKAYLDDMKRELREHAESVETRLLREFWKWARTADARYRQHLEAVSGLAERVGIVEDRVADLERGRRALAQVTF